MIVCLEGKLRRKNLFFACICICCLIFGEVFLTVSETAQAAEMAWMAETSEAERLAYQPELFSDFHAEDLTLYAKSAVLIDCTNNRILYGKNANTPMANASTTKILTCILALESGKTEEIVTVSDYACSMPRVKLGFSSGDTFYLGDLLYSLMLESHNDSAVAIAEHIGGSVEHFAEMMNQKAEELGCKNSHFITPNGLDGEDEGGIHSTTAYDLSCIMSYCIENPEFLAITQTSSKQIQNVEGTRSYSLTNHNALLSMVDGAISGKTGFTGNAGYCYVGAYEKDGRKYALALLACGWPNNKSYKWSDAKKLIAYGNDNYEQKTYICEGGDVSLSLQGGVCMQDGYKYPDAVSARYDQAQIQMLLSGTDEITTDFEMPDHIAAPAEEGTVIGKETVYLNQCPVVSRDIYLTETIDRFDFTWCVKTVLSHVMGKSAL